MKKDDVSVVEKLKNKLEDARNKHDMAFSNLPAGLSFPDMQKALKVTGSELMEASRQYRLVQPYVLSELEKDKDNDIMTLDDFISNCKSGGFIDYDGHGYYMNDGKISDVMIIPSDIEHNYIRREFDSVIWYNK